MSRSRIPAFSQVGFRDEAFISIDARPFLEFGFFDPADSFKDVKPERLQFSINIELVAELAPDALRQAAERLIKLADEYDPPRPPVAVPGDNSPALGGDRRQVRP